MKKSLRLTDKQKKILVAIIDNGLKNANVPEEDDKETIGIDEYLKRYNKYADQLKVAIKVLDAWGYKTDDLVSEEKIICDRIESHYIF